MSTISFGEGAGCQLTLIWRIRVALLLILCSPPLPGLAAPPPANRKIFEEVWETTRDNFFDPAMRGLDWEGIRKRYAPLADQAQSDGELSAVINQMLAELKTSHTHYFTPEEPEYYQLCGIFWPVLKAKLEPFLPDKKLAYPGIGIATLSKNNGIFVQSIFDGFPAAAAGLKVGDRILSADREPFHPIHSFAGKTNQIVELRVQREKEPSFMQVLRVTPKLIDPTTMFLDAMKASVRMIENKGRKIGYIHLWSYAGETYQEQLGNELNDRLKAADGLILDLRDGWGGASPTYLWPFVAPPLTITSSFRNGKRLDENLVWTKPVCLLINERSRSGKELFAYYFKKTGRGHMVGSRSAGQVMIGKPFVLSNGSVLYLAVGDGRIDDIRLEGRGIVPDTEVAFALEYAQGADPQLTRALEVIGMP